MNRPIICYYFDFNFRQPRSFQYSIDNGSKRFILYANQPIQKRARSLKLCNFHKSITLCLEYLWTAPKKTNESKSIELAERIFQDMFVEISSFVFSFLVFSHKTHHSGHILGDNCFNFIVEQNLSQWYDICINLITSISWNQCTNLHFIYQFWSTRLNINKLASLANLNKA